MKKGLVIGIVIAIVIVAILIGAVVFGSKAIKGKVAITSDDFKTKMEEKSYIVSDATSQFASYSYVKKVYVSAPKDYSYKIEFYTLEDEEYAKAFYDNNKSIFEASKTASSVQTNVNLKNSSKYTLNTDGKYKVVSRIGNTVMYLNVNSEYKDTVNEILKEFGY